MHELTARSRAAARLLGHFHAAADVDEQRQADGAVRATEIEDLARLVRCRAVEIVGLSFVTGRPRRSRTVAATVTRSTAGPEHRALSFWAAPGASRSGHDRHQNTARSGRMTASAALYQLPCQRSGSAEFGAKYQSKNACRKSDGGCVTVTYWATGDEA